MLVLTGAALALYFTLRWLPTGTNLHHGDFRVDQAGGPGSTLEFCDPANPQFLPVVAVRSPVETWLGASGPVRAGVPAEFTLRLATTTGKPIGSIDLLETHTRRLHVMAVDPTLRDYQHVHPEPGAAPGEWVFTLTPRASGTYRFFCDFTPAATARGLYASADLVVAEGAGEELGAPPAAAASTDAPLTYQSGDYRFTLESSRWPVRSRDRAQLALSIRRVDGGAVQLEEVMGAYAHLVAFDESRSGFAHLHPLQAANAALDPKEPRLAFEVTIPSPGRYVIWAQVALDGEERFVPFWIDVAT